MRKNAVEIKRKTKETDICLSLDMTGKGVDIDTPVAFFNHMLTAMAFHGGFALSVKAAGDVDVDPHHLVEDIGLVLGDALAQSAAKTGVVKRYGYSIIPMDEAVSEAVIDICGRPSMVLNAEFPQPKAGTFDMSLIREFLIALSNRAQIALHCTCRYGQNSHHMAEALFKALGKALEQAYAAANSKQVLSTKGLI
ncbi:MAG: imidazoleglycerol-phosphate dehydratase HisB [Spirochaetia bacterium]|nr:imidazoleglycerol-phosphate dehydratase HisB [Spirochaetia bacterium]